MSKITPGCLAVVKRILSQPRMTDRVVVCVRCVSADTQLWINGELHGMGDSTIHDLMALNLMRTWVVKPANPDAPLEMVDETDRWHMLPEAMIPEAHLRPILPPPGELTPDPESVPILEPMHAEA